MHIPLEDQASRVRVKYGRERRYCKECGGKGICERGGCAEGAKTAAAKASASRGGSAASARSAGAAVVT